MVSLYGLEGLGVRAFDQGTGELSLSGDFGILGLGFRGSEVEPCGFESPMRDSSTYVGGVGGRYWCQFWGPDFGSNFQKQKKSFHEEKKLSQKPAVAYWGIRNKGIYIYMYHI